MKLQELKESVSNQDLSALEKYLDAVFKPMKIDIEWSKHFGDRINDPRNGKEITVEELKKMFQAIFKQHSKVISKQADNFEGLLKDVATEINIPFVVRWDSKNDEVDLISKTVMRKKNFKSGDKKFPVNTKGSK